MFCFSIFKTKHIRTLPHNQFKYTQAVLQVKEPQISKDTLPEEGGRGKVKAKGEK